MILGLTGSIATGKSTVATLFKQKGVPVICADEIAHQLTNRDSPVLKQIAQLFGHQFINSDGSLNRALLGELVFKDDSKRNQLNELLHPMVRAEINRQVHAFKQQGKTLIVLDIPLLFESKLEHLCDKILVAYSTTEQQKERLIKRNKLTIEEANSRINSQMSIDKKRKLADYVLDNSGTEEQLQKQFEDFFIELNAD